MDAPNPEQRKREIGARTGNGCKCKGWAQSTLDGILDSEEYSHAKKAFDSEYSDLSRSRDEAIQRRNSFFEAMSEDNKWIKLMESVSTATRLTQELVDETIELIKVHEGGDIELTMKYKDIYELTVQSIKDVREVMK